ncbi:LOW QUALITY PROTEIN: constitutive coactivator of PPAR-gamma-like protein 1 homolog [Ptychodera flava]|uniref:LOW QUALITY PROTEIN: constitutive coactivator of PPAR-gamma-like protein 1 homolog n=1 Tax=Ptychodera flava TaxID=63121 RepID=UPI00396A95F6
MGIQGLLEFIERNCPQACVQVDLQKIGRSRKRSKTGENPLYLVIDADSCLHRLYGGSFSDWVCGGQWNYMFQFIDNLARACRSSNIQLVVFFNGSFEKSRMQEWIRQQGNSRQAVHQIFSHVHSKNTPPPRMWFIPPVCLDTCVRLALLQCGITVASSYKDHLQEVIGYCRDYGCHGVLAQSSEYCIFDPPKLFSSHQLKLTRSGNLLTVQYLIDELAKELDLNPNRFVIFAALVGNHILPDEDLALFHWYLLGPGHPLSNLKQARTHQLVMPPTDTVIRAVAAYVRSLPSVDDLDAIAQDVFKNSQAKMDDKITRFKQCVNYFYAGTRQGWRQKRNMRPPPRVMEHPMMIAPQQMIGEYYESLGYTDPAFGQGWHPPPNEHGGSNAVGHEEHGHPAVGAAAPQIVVQAPEQTQTNLERAFESEVKSHIEEDLEKGMADMTLENIEEDTVSEGDSVDQETRLRQKQQTPTNSTDTDKPKQGSDHVSSETSSTTSSSSNGTAGNDRIGRNTAWADQMSQQQQHTAATTTTTTDANTTSKSCECSQTSSTSSTPASNTSSASSSTANIPSLMSQPVPPCMIVSVPKLPHVPPEVLRIAHHRLQEGLMMPLIYQVLSGGEIKLPCTIEDETSRELPSSALLFRLVRQYVYGILYSVQHLNARRRKPTKPPSRNKRLVIIKEWCVRKDSSVQKPDLVEAVALPWPIPPCRQLWCGRTLQDKNIRTRAFLSCMLSDTPGMMKNSYVPRHAIILCCVLRYMLQSKYPVLRRHELDAFLAQSVSPMLHDPNALQELQIPHISVRGIQLAALFMRGVEAALTANDACGAPVPWVNCCPWLFFDGKLFQYKLYKGSQSKSLKDVCDGQMDQVGKVERMRQVIMEGISDNLVFAKPTLPKMMNSGMYGYPPMYPNFRPAGAVPPLPRHRGMGGKHTVNNRGGKLEVAGVVVSEWAGNRGGRGRSQMPQTSMSGPPRRGGYGVVSSGALRGRGRGVGRGKNYSEYYRHGAKSAALWGLSDTAPSKAEGGSGKRKKNVSVKKAGKTGKSKGEIAPSGNGVGRGCTIQSGDSSIHVSELAKAGSFDTTKHNGDAESGSDEETEDTNSSSSTTSTIEEQPHHGSEVKFSKTNVTSDNPEEQTIGDDIVSSVVSSVVDSIAASEDDFPQHSGNGTEAGKFPLKYSSPEGRLHLQKSNSSDSPDSGVNVELGRTPEKSS